MACLVLKVDFLDGWDEMDTKVAIGSCHRYIESILFDDDINWQSVQYAFLECTDDCCHVLLRFQASFLLVRNAMAGIDICLVSEIEQLGQMANRTVLHDNCIHRTSRISGCTQDGL